MFVIVGVGVVVDIVVDVVVDGDVFTAVVVEGAVEDRLLSL